MDSSHTSRRPALAVKVGASATVLAFLDTTVTNLAVPPVAAEFSVGVTAAAWVATAYVIPFAAFLAPAGVAADAAGRARLFRFGVGLFTACSLVIALAPTFELLLVGRALQGVGAALMTPASLALILAEVPPERRRAAIGLWSGAGALAAAAGPALGGVVIEWIDWRAVFCINVPLGVWVVWAARPLRAGDAATRRLPDVLGSLLIAVAIGALVLGLSEAPARGWGSWFVLAAAAVAILATVGAVRRASSHEHPGLRIDLLRNRGVAVTTGISTAYGIALFATMLLGVLFLVEVWQYSALRAGLAMTPAALAAAVVGLGVGRVKVPFPPRRMIAVGATLQATSSALLALSISTTPQFLGLWLPVGTLMGIGVGLATVGISTAGATASAPQDFAAVTGLLMAARQLGGALGIAVLSVLLVQLDATTAVRPYAGVYWFTTLASLLALTGAALLRPVVPHVPTNQPTTPPAKETHR
ncbi:MFS transporter [Nocardioides sp.]|uniref:MFS transporter n=1 Tax=Nocardioides sp. TaxID=35761 RepID=UPI00198F2279|nr:MFS transporter [Nocardioides sp.]MBC7279527.1 MFS transporter [Nocardioides sp.]